MSDVTFLINLFSACQGLQAENPKAAIGCQISVVGNERDGAIAWGGGQVFYVSPITTFIKQGASPIDIEVELPPSLAGGCELHFDPPNAALGGQGNFAITLGQTHRLGILRKPTIPAPPPLVSVSIALLRPDDLTVVSQGTSEIIGAGASVLTVDGPSFGGSPTAVYLISIASQPIVAGEAVAGGEADPGSGTGGEADPGSGTGGEADPGLRRLESELADPSAPRFRADHLCFVTVRGDKPLH